MNNNKNEMSASVTFPLTADEFAALLTAYADRKPGENDKVLANLLVGIVNKYYERGKNGAPYKSVHEAVEHLSDEQKSIANEVPSIFELADVWCKLAYDAGHAAAKAEER